MAWHIRWDFLKNSVLLSLLLIVILLFWDRMGLKDLPFPSCQDRGPALCFFSQDLPFSPIKPQIHHLYLLKAPSALWKTHMGVRVHTHPQAMNGYRSRKKAPSLPGGTHQWNGKSLGWKNNDFQKEYIDSPCSLIEIRPWKNCYAVVSSMPINSC